MSETVETTDVERKARRAFKVQLKGDSCPTCCADDDKIRILGGPDGRWLECKECGSSSPRCSTWQDALMRWPDEAKVPDE